MVATKPKKDGRKVSFVLDSTLDKKLSIYCQREYRSRTNALEKILKTFFDEYEKKNEKLK